MYGQYKRGGEAGEQEVGLLVVAPGPRATPPTQAQQPVQELAEGVLGAISRDRQVRQQPRVPEQGADREIGADGHDIEHQRRQKVGPQQPLVGDRKHVVNLPDPAQVDEGEKPGTADREHGHGLGRARDRVAPTGPEQVQDGRNERPGVGDTDPEHEIDEVGAPGHGDVLAADADAGEDLVGPGGGAQEHAAQQERDKDPVARPGPLQGVQNGLVDLSVGEVGHIFALRAAPF